MVAMKTLVCRLLVDESGAGAVELGFAALIAAFVLACAASGIGIGPLHPIP
jgi:Flp pilus assembly pilin Flp